MIGPQTGFEPTNLAIAPDCARSKLRLQNHFHAFHGPNTLLGHGRSRASTQNLGEDPLNRVFSQPARTALIPRASRRAPYAGTRNRGLPPGASVSSFVLTAPGGQSLHVFELFDVALSRRRRGLILRYWNELQGGDELRLSCRFPFQNIRNNRYVWISHDRYGFSERRWVLGDDRALALAVKREWRLFVLLRRFPCLAQVLQTN